LYAYEEAARHFVDALEISSIEDDVGRCEVLLGLGRVRSLAGGTLDADRLWQVPARARDAYLEAFKCAERSGNHEQLAEAALGVGERYFEMTYSDSNHLEFLEKALRQVSSVSARAMLLAKLAANHAFPHENAKASERAELAIRMARGLGNEHLLFAVLLARHVTLLDIEFLDERLRIGDELGALAPGRQEFAAEYRLWRMYDFLELGDIGGARREQARLDEIARSLGQPLYRSIAAGAQSLLAELDGDLAEAERASETSREHAASARTLDATSAWAGQVYRRWLLERDPDRLKDLMADVEALVAGGGHKLGWRSALAMLRLELGDEQGARALYDVDMRHRPRGMFRLAHTAWLGELAARFGDTAGAKLLYDELLPYRHRNVVVSYCSFWGPVDGFLGRLAHTLGRNEEATAHTGFALQRAREMRAPLLVEQLETALKRLGARQPSNRRAWAHHGPRR
jgi:hypothetical protein